MARAGSDARGGSSRLRARAARAARSSTSADPGEIRELSLRIFDRSFAVTYALEAVAVLVGLFGLSSSLGALVLARRREFGMLRHLGMTRRADRRACSRPKGGLLARSARPPASCSALAISLILIHVVNRQSFHWSMELQLPWLLLAALTLVLLALAVADRGRSGAARRWAMDAGARGAGGLVSAPTPFLAALLALWRCRRMRGCAIPPSSAGPPLAFPRDHGAHPEFRTEWWYVTGWVVDGSGPPFGFQVTFFRNAPGVAEAQRQRVRAAAAHLRARRARRSAARPAASRPARRAGGIRSRRRGRSDDAALIDDWSLAADRQAAIAAQDRGARVRVRPRLHADAAAAPAGRRRRLSARVPRPMQASYYYSEPQLAVSGTLTIGGTTVAVTGNAWLDHEWSSTVMAPEAAAGTGRASTWPTAAR